MSKINLLFILLVIPFLGFGQWKKESSRNISVKESKKNVQASQFYSLDISKMSQSLENAPQRFGKAEGTVISLPNVEGKLMKYKVWEASNFSQVLQAKYPQIRAYVGQGVDNPKAYLRMSISPKGISSMVIQDGKSEYIERASQNGEIYMIYNSTSHRKNETIQFQCEVHGDQHSEGDHEYQGEGVMAGNIKTYRMALSCTGEYGVYHGGTVPDVLAAFNETMTRINGLYEKDVAVNFELIDQVEDLIFLNPSTDPYTSGGPDEANTRISSLVGSSSYDIGHLLDREGANGAAYLDVCGVRKAGGWTAHNFPEGAAYDIDYVAHEMGHQMGAGHTYTIYAPQADRTVEPGSGNTIMAYTGITGNLDVQANSFDYFHAASIAQIKAKVNSLPNCGTASPMPLDPPVVNAGSDYTIPQSTPFVLNGDVTGPNSENYTYNWEQIDLASSAQYGSNSIAYPTKPTGPNFRSFAPVADPVRYFPEYRKVLAGVFTTRWESVSSINRNLNFALTARNNSATEPQSARDDMRVTVNAAAGPFVVTAPELGQSLLSGSPFTVTWDVAGTDQAPINTAFVNIKLSTDGGDSFTTLVENTANDGSESVTIPAGSTTENAYILVEPVGNVYYAVSPSFVIDYIVTGESCETYTYNGPEIDINDGPGGNDITSVEVVAPLQIADQGTITKLNVKLDVTHTNVSHLNIGIESPYGTRALVWNRTCPSRSGINATFTDEAASVTCASPVVGNNKSNESLSVFNGLTAAGEWKIYASDNRPGAVGKINSWSIEVCKRSTESMNVTDFQYSDFQIYPNPSKGEFNIDANNVAAGAVSTLIYDISGKLVYKSDYQHNGGKLAKKHNVSLPSGVYVVYIKTANNQYNQKLIIK